MDNNNYLRRSSKLERKFSRRHQMLTKSLNKEEMALAGLTEEDKKQLTAWIGGAEKEYKLLYKATQHGLSAAAFHQRCDNKGPTLTVAYTNTGYTFGGYTDESFNSSSTGIMVFSNNAFLFRLSQAFRTVYERYPARKAGIYCSPAHGPTFGNATRFELCCFTNGPHALYRRTTYFAYNMIGFTTGVGTYGAFDDKGQGANALWGKASHFIDFEVYEVTDMVHMESTRVDSGEWRKVKFGWTENAKEDLIREISSYRLPECVKVPEVRILLIGQVGAGKSSFYNSISSIYRGYPIYRAAAGSATHSLTTVYRAYTVRNERYEEAGAPRVRLCDTMGLENDNGLDISDIAYIIDGNVQDYFQFNPAAKIHPDHKEFKKDAKLKDKIHVVAFVLDGSKAELLSPAMMTKMKSIRQHALQRGVPVAILLTKIEKVCSKVMESTSSVYSSSNVYKAIEEIAEKFGVPKAQVYPVKNYENEIELSTPIDILALTALRQLLRLADSYFDDVIDRYCLTREVKGSCEAGVD